MVLITLTAIGVTALVTGLSSYFILRPTENHHNLATNMTAATAANITNDVILEQPNILGILTVLLLIVIVIFKVVELLSVGIGAYKRSMKKRYAKRQLLPLTTIQSTNLPSTSVATIATTPKE